jgi:hypothetical protein
MKEEVRMKSVDSSSAKGVISSNFWFISKKVLGKVRRYSYYKESMVLLKKPITHFNDPDMRSSLVVKANDREPEIVDLLKSAFPKKAKIFDWRLRKGVLLLVSCLPQGDLVGSCWFAPGEFYEPASRFTVTLAENQVYEFDGIVLSEFRRRKLAEESIRSMWNYVLDKDYSEIWRPYFDTLL